jgi:hypothetical protein
VAADNRFKKEPNAMSAIREAAEQSAAGLLTINKRADALLLAISDLYRKLDAVTAILGEDGDDADRLKHHFLTLADHERRDGILEAVAKLESHSPEALARFLADREDRNRRELVITTDRSPRSGRATPGRSILATETDPKTGEVLRAFGQSPLQPGE